MDHLIVGLGNPGQKYSFTRHNIGFLSIDLLSEFFEIPVEKKYKKSLIGRGRIGETEVLLMKPLTFMNASGTVILSALTRFRVEPRNLIVIYDDLDLPLGRVRIRKKGASAGHKGVDSVIGNIGSSDFIRIRIGIGTEEKSDHPAEEFVLSEFTAGEKKVLKKCVKQIPSIVHTIITHSVEKAMNEYN